MFASLELCARRGQEIEQLSGHAQLAGQLVDAESGARVQWRAASAGELANFIERANKLRELGRTRANLVHLLARVACCKNNDNNNNNNNNSRGGGQGIGASGNGNNQRRLVFRWPAGRPSGQANRLAGRPPI